MRATITKKMVSVGDLGTLTAGTEVDVLDHGTGWSRVRLDDGQHDVVRSDWFANVAVYRPADQLGY